MNNGAKERIALKIIFGLGITAFFILWLQVGFCGIDPLGTDDNSQIMPALEDTWSKPFAHGLYDSPDEGQEKIIITHEDEKGDTITDTREEYDDEGNLISQTILNLKKR